VPPLRVLLALEPRAAQYYFHTINVLRGPARNDVDKIPIALIGLVLSVKAWLQQLVDVELLNLVWAVRKSPSRYVKNHRRASNE
jgi:hypothetical protein